jgi:NADPH:quinone reductase-like Zn-dependent oxidoreductase
MLPMPHVLGSDVAGVVEAVGPGADGSGVEPGMEVVLNPGTSCGRCEECLDNVLPKPRDLSFEEAACIPLVFLTAWHALVGRAQVKPGETVLIHAAGSGVGSAAVQITRLVGARVLGLSEARTAHELLARREQFGKVVLVL